jgi:hypothetical protein
MTVIEKDKLRAELESSHGQVWTTDELTQDFKVKGFSYGVVVVQRLSDGVIGTLDFTHMPRFYYSFQPE